MTDASAADHLKVRTLDTKAGIPRLSSLLAPIDFEISISEPSAYCLSGLEKQSQAHGLGPSQFIQIHSLNSQNYEFSITRPRRLIPIKAQAVLQSTGPSSTAIIGSSKARYELFLAVLVGGLLLAVLVILTSHSGRLCFGGLATAILIVGATVELLGQYYARLGLFTSIKRLFPTQPETKTE